MTQTVSLKATYPTLSLNENKTIRNKHPVFTPSNKKIREVKVTIPRFCTGTIEQRRKHKQKLYSSIGSFILRRKIYRVFVGIKTTQKRSVEILKLLKNYFCASN